MKISYSWLQSYFEEKLPLPEKLAELLEKHLAEVEAIVESGDDTIFDVKVLPDRACYALSHRGMAYEVSALTGIPKKALEYPKPPVSKVRPLEVRVEATDLCIRYMARVVENVTAKEMPWVKEHLESIGQRSINPIVDGANIVMFDMGQPLHAFDADKIEGGIIVRRARKGEKITTLDNREVELDESILVIADEKSPIAIAGIKGGKKAEVAADTKNIVLEAANFDASYIRRASVTLGIKTDASKRFENRLSPSLASVGMSDFTAYLYEMDKNISVGEIIETPRRYSDVLKNIRITTEYINKKLGLEITEAKIEKALSSLLITVKKENGYWFVTPPAFRVDLEIPEDIAEEVGRIYGYDKIPATLPPVSKGNLELNKTFYYQSKVQQILVGAGFSEVMTSSFADRGEVEIEKPLAADKKFLRPNLRGGFAAALRANTLNAPLFSDDKVKIFEIGKVFPVSGEHLALAIGCAGPKNKAATALKEIRTALAKAFGHDLFGEEKDFIFECNFGKVIEKLPEPKMWDITFPEMSNDKFVPFSLYPFIVRDVAVFVPRGVEESDVEKIILANIGALVVKHYLFDRFEKDGKISYAFRLVFQSFERTLTDAEVNTHMDKVYKSVAAAGWQVR